MVAIQRKSPPLRFKRMLCEAEIMFKTSVIPNIFFHIKHSPPPGFFCTRRKLLRQGIWKLEWPLNKLSERRKSFRILQRKYFLEKKEIAQRQHKSLRILEEISRKRNINFWSNKKTINVTLKVLSADKLFKSGLGDEKHPESWFFCEG